MKVINVGNEFNIYDDFVESYDQLPADIYYLRFAPMRGFFFERKSDFDIGEEKIYGDHTEKLDKVFRAYDSSDRNLGVIISGDKGIGKSLFAKMLSNKMIENGYPVIIVNQPYSNIPDIVDRIDQKCLVLFDEFEKMFIDDDIDSDATTQNSLLSMFDGINNNKKLFVITCNKLTEVSEYIINRPGRFHYHLRFSYPSPDEVETYLKDNIEERYYDQIEPVKKFSSVADINYDCLRSIAFELNLGYTFKDAIKDLNIINYNVCSRYNAVLTFTDNSQIVIKSLTLDLLGDEHWETFSVYHESDDYAGEIRFNTKDVLYDDSADIYYLVDDTIRFKPVEYDNDMNEVFKNKVPKSLTFKRSRASYEFLI